LVSQSGHSLSTLRRIITEFLEQEPPERKVKIQSSYWILDGTYLEKRKGLFCVMDGNQNTIIAQVMNMKERYKDLRGFFEKLDRQNWKPEIAIIDGNPAIAKSLYAVWPDILLQRCLLHIRHQGLRWCRDNPKLLATRQLRELFHAIRKIKTQIQKEQFLLQVQEWEKCYGKEILTSTNRGPVFGDLIRARSMLLSALPDMFTYLDYPDIPTTTNALEGYFGRMKQKYRCHPGLSRSHAWSFIKWYLYLCPK
jgi:transposase-like protein